MTSKAELLTTAELIDSLLTRFDALAFCGVQDRKDASGEGMVISWRRKGDHHRCIGLTHYAATRIQEDLDKITEPTDASNL